MRFEVASHRQRPKFNAVMSGGRQCFRLFRRFPFVAGQAATLSRIYSTVPPYSTARHSGYAGYALCFCDTVRTLTLPLMGRMRGLD